MANLVFRGFNGQNPYVDAELLQDNFAQIAKNVRLIGGDIQPSKATTDVVTVLKEDPKTIYRFGQDSPTDTQFWFTFSTDVDIVKGAVDGDTSERTYYTGDGFPKVTNSSLALSGDDLPFGFLRLGIPIPTARPFATPTTRPNPPADDPNEPPITSVYLVTYVSAFGEEGAGSPPSNLATYKTSQQFVRLSGLPMAPTGQYNITRKRIYRSATASTTAIFRFVAEIPIGQETYDDFIPDNLLGEQFSTRDYVPPPDGMKGLCLMANGIYAGFMGNTLYFSPLFIPYAYPEDFQLSVDNEIIGIKSFGQSLFVGTRANPYIITGLDPDSLPQNKLPQNQALVSKRSMVAMLNGVVYASPDGVCMATEVGVSVLTEKLLTREQWQSYKPSSMHCYQINNEYIVFYDNGTKKGHIVFDFTGKQAMMTEGDEWYPSAYNDRFSDTLFVADKFKIKRWDTGANETAQWKSKKFRFPLQTGFSRGHVEAEAYPVTFNVYRDGVLFYSKIVTDRKPFPIPAGHGTLWEVEVFTNSRVKSFNLTDTQAGIV